LETPEFESAGKLQYAVETLQTLCTPHFFGRPQEGNLEGKPSSKIKRKRKKNKKEVEKRNGARAGWVEHHHSSGSSVELKKSDIVVAQNGASDGKCIQNV